MSSGSEAWAILKLHNAHEAPRKWIDSILIKSHPDCIRGISEFILIFEIRIKYAETVPFCNNQNNFVLRTNLEFAVGFRYKSDL